MRRYGPLAWLSVPTGKFRKSSFGSSKGLYKLSRTRLSHYRKKKHEKTTCGDCLAACGHLGGVTLQIVLGISRVLQKGKFWHRQVFKLRKRLKSNFWLSAKMKPLQLPHVCTQGTQWAATSCIYFYCLNLIYQQPLEPPAFAHPSLFFCTGLGGIREGKEEKQGWGCVFAALGGWGWDHNRGSNKDKKKWSNNHFFYESVLFL